jgi:hypothetical protein
MTNRDKTAAGAAALACTCEEAPRPRATARDGGSFEVASRWLRGGRYRCGLVQDRTDIGYPPVKRFLPATAPASRRCAGIAPSGSAPADDRGFFAAVSASRGVDRRWPAHRASFAVVRRHRVAGLALAGGAFLPATALYLLGEAPTSRGFDTGAYLRPCQIFMNQMHRGAPEGVLGGRGRGDLAGSLCFVHRWSVLERGRWVMQLHRSCGDGRAAACAEPRHRRRTARRPRLPTAHAGREHRRGTHA